MGLWRSPPLQSDVGFFWENIMTTLLGSFDLHGLALPNRVVMAPMTRTRATDDRVPTKLMATIMFSERRQD
jgi:2,4-dienoyl-CoA reductase-like NADH-dependent reductase (Old Yellow Enzyme family)